MGRPSKVKQLPPELLDDLNARLVGQGFSGYDELVEWLRAKGFYISRSSLHRHGSALEAEFEEAMADARRTRALARASREAGDNDGALMSATAGILQDNLLRVSLAAKREGEDDPAAAAKTLSLISRAFADVGRMDIAHQKWMAELQAKAAEVADKAAKLASKGGLSAESIAELRRSILGIAA